MTTIVVVIIVIIVVIIMVVVAVLAADVMTMDPVMAVSHMTWNPGHFIVARPIARAMAVVWPVANLDFDPLRSNSGGKKETHRNNGDEQKFVFNHNTH
jgi:hypothetical protein